MSEANKQQIVDLLADKAIVGLSDTELLELEALEKEFPEFAVDESFDEAAAVFHVALTEIEEMPSHIKNRLIDSGEEYVRSNYSKPVNVVTEMDAETQSSGMNVLGWLGWAVAGAAVLLLALTFFGTERPTAPEIAKEVKEERVPTISEKRETLLASASKVSAEWATNEPYKNLDVKGDVVWSDEKQEGYMTFEGLPVNDTSKETYQLWVFDENQSDKTPVDGGVFDVTKEGKVTIPIDAKLKVKGAKMFAITIEKPGGVVVSDRSKLVLLGKVEA